MNPKTWVTSIACVSAFAIPGEGYYWQLAALALHVLWAGFGVGLGAWLARGGTMTVVNRVLAVVLAATVIVFWLPH